MTIDASSGDPPFGEGQCVFAYLPSKDRIHDAKVLKVEFLDGEWKYLVHYTRSCLSPSDDVWLTIDFLMESTFENFSKMVAFNKLQAESIAKLWKEKWDETKRQKREFALTYEAMIGEFRATYGSQVRGMQEYMTFHMNERAKPPGERRARPEGGFKFERVTEEELRQQEAEQAAFRATILSIRASNRRIMNSRHSPERKKYQPYS